MEAQEELLQKEALAVIEKQIAPCAQTMSERAKLIPVFTKQLRDVIDQTETLRSPWAKALWAFPTGQCPGSTAGDAFRMFAAEGAESR